MVKVTGAKKPVYMSLFALTAECLELQSSFMVIKSASAQCSRQNYTTKYTYNNNNNTKIYNTHSQALNMNRICDL